MAADLVLRAVLEAAALVAWGLAGAAIGGWPASIAVVVAIAGLWGLFVSPKARWRIPVVRALVEGVAFLGAVAALGWLGRFAWAALLMAGILVHWGLGQRGDRHGFTT